MGEPPDNSIDSYAETSFRTLPRRLEAADFWPLLAFALATLSVACGGGSGSRAGVSGIAPGVTSVDHTTMMDGGEGSFTAP
jgi:hypothetical protein